MFYELQILILTQAALGKTHQAPTLPSTTLEAPVRKGCSFSSSKLGQRHKAKKEIFYNAGFISL
jgi:hypothetical protein